MKVVKNLQYPDFDYLTEEWIKEQNHTIQFSTYMFLGQNSYGNRLYVQKELSDELKNVDLFDVELKDLPIVFTSIEFYFEDKNLSTILFSFACYENTQDEKMIAILWENCDGTCNLVTYKSESFSEIMKKNYDPSNKSANQDDINKYKDQKDILEINMFYVRLIVKILLYISIPEYKSIPISEKQLKREGKSGVKNRPNRPLSKVIFVPSIININKNESTTGISGAKKKPHFRRGHFMMLRHERFKEKGRLIFVKPCMIHGGSIKDKLYIARKIE